MYIIIGFPGEGGGVIVKTLIEDWSIFVIIFWEGGLNRKLPPSYGHVTLRNPTPKFRSGAAIELWENADEWMTMPRWTRSLTARMLARATRELWWRRFFYISEWSAARFEVATANKSAKTAANCRCILAHGVIARPSIGIYAVNGKV